MSKDTQAAQDLAVQALGYMAADAEMIEGFLAATGLRLDDLRRAGQSPEFAGAVLDFLAEDDQRILGFAQSLGIDPVRVQRARTLLAGPGSEGWSVD